MKFFLLLPLIALIGCAAQLQQASDVRPAPQPSAEISYPCDPPPQPTCSHLQAEFLVTQNSLYSEKIRHMEVFLTPSAFSERNLRELFGCLSKDNPEPSHLTVELETDWSRVRIPDGKPGSGASNMPPDPHEYDFLQAIYFRRPGRGDSNGREYFRYSPRPHLDQFYFTTVILKK